MKHPDGQSGNDRKTRPVQPAQSVQEDSLEFLSLKLVVIILFAGLIVIFALYKAVDLIPPKIVDPRFKPSMKISFNEQGGDSNQVPSPQETGKLPLRIAIAPVISPETSMILYKDLVNYLGKELDRETVTLQRGSYAQINDLIRYAQCDMAFICTYPFVQGERDFGLKLLAVPVIGGKITYQSFIIVPRSSQAASLMGLRGKKFASSDLLSNSGWLFPYCWLKGRGKDPENFFKKHLITGSHDRSVLAVASQYVDGAAVDSLVYEQMVEADISISEKTKIVFASPPFGMPPLVVHPGIDPVLKAQLLEVILGMHADPEGKEALRSLKIDKFVVPNNDIYDSVRQMMKIRESN